MRPCSVGDAVGARCCRVEYWGARCGRSGDRDHVVAGSDRTGFDHLAMAGPERLLELTAVRALCLRTAASTAFGSSLLSFPDERTGGDPHGLRRFRLHLLWCPMTACRAPHSEEHNSSGQPQLNRDVAPPVLEPSGRSGGTFLVTSQGSTHPQLCRKLVISALYSTGGLAGPLSCTRCARKAEFVASAIARRCWPPPRAA